MSMYEDFDAGPASQKKKSGSWTCLTIALVGGFAVILLCCGGGVGIFWYGMGAFSAEIESQLRDNEQLKQHIGAIETFRFDFSRSGEGDGKAMFFQVKGSLGEGHVAVVIEPDQQGRQQVVEATLHKSDGTQVPLVP
jgi:hypothetical protein